MDRQSHKRGLVDEAARAPAASTQPTYPRPQASKPKTRFAEAKGSPKARMPRSQAKELKTYILEAQRRIHQLGQHNQGPSILKVDTHALKSGYRNPLKAPEVYHTITWTLWDSGPPSASYGSPGMYGLSLTLQSFTASPQYLWGMLEKKVSLDPGLSQLVG